jgi:valyl-tRNA synthetase
MENIKDCVSVASYGGDNRIPAYLSSAGGYVVAMSGEEAFEKALAKVDYPLSINDLKQMMMCSILVLFMLWPYFGIRRHQPPHNKEIAYYYPTSDW